MALAEIALFLELLDAGGSELVKNLELPGALPKLFELLVGVLGSRWGGGAGGRWRREGQRQRIKGWSGTRVGEDVGGGDCVHDACVRGEKIVPGYYVLTEP